MLHFIGAMWFSTKQHQVEVLHLAICFVKRVNWQVVGLVAQSGREDKLLRSLNSPCSMMFINALVQERESPTVCSILPPGL